MSTTHAVSSAHLSPIDLLGTRLENTFTAEEAMKHGKLGGWNVRKAPAWTTDPETGLTIPMDGRNAVIRNDPDRPGQINFLGDVGNSHHLMQNEEHADLLNAIVEESGAHFELAGSMEDGRKVFLSMKLPGHINVGGVDPIENSLLGINSFDGSMSFTLAVLPVRYACSNTMHTGKGAPNLIRVRHTSGLKNNLVVKARETLDITFRYLEGFQEQAERLINKTMTQAQFEAIITREFSAPEDASQAAVTRAERKIEEIEELFADAQTQDGIRDTAWAGFNALVEWNDHFAPTRGNDRDVARAAKAILDPSFKDRALELMLAA